MHALVHKVSLKHRVMAALIIGAGGFGVWYVTRVDGWFKVFEFSFTPFIDKVIFGLEQ